ncbi:N-acetyl-gamma-glutamyl-phosphate reductase [Micromonospora endophytica]|uniref:N-acetyl-gamma-glutamyl-phosphate reductase n=1 Tax=Micromonospora endophytica TaxID=515350 RepID=A0A2W2CBN3_9ACTN|nr:N-acetyl-gamma-glutamyl-phosphate reductase [Micromonospora endophytica]PZF95100.1 N-acetyl-gamma-glutamyl-phosphate reductase [Micromonospora endophytica]RIW49921.1 N-acetyl-gamma-glutamyl-phosphate reductase [Micromonospora endophytica]BCJ57127.1 N-acetyl-gamma-glutamyl-phosphate reductase [Micromonospora endophytica]
MGIQVAVAGASGYAGGELLRLLAGHPEFDLVTATAHSKAGQRLDAVHPQLTGLDMTFVETVPDVLADADLVFLALPHGESAALAAQLPAGVRIVDLGADHRLTDSDAWTRYYGGPHAGAWTYGLPELPGQRERIAASTRVANTGCYAATITLALAPLIAAGVAQPADVVVVAASGTSGAGRAAKAHLLGSEVMGDLSPYKVGAHQHVPEIKQATGATGLSFTPVLAPMPRGILATVTALPAGNAADSTAGNVADSTAGNAADADPRAVLARAYADAPFVHLLPEGRWPHTAATLGGNSCHLQATVDVDSGRLIVVAALDNLGKGAAGQAVQNANLMFGLPETTGLSSWGVAP